MSRHIQNMRKIEAEKSQLRSILSDFRKTKHKCIALYDELKTEFTDRAEFQAIEKQVTIKMDLLDALGLVQLKNKLVKYLSELFDLQAQLNTQKERIAARKQFSKLNNMNETSRNQPKSSKNMTQPFIPKPKRVLPSNQLSNPVQSNTTTGSNTSTSKNEKTGVTNIPIYHMSDDSSEVKVERITKFIAALKSKQQKQVGNMVMHSDENSTHKIKEILEEDPEYKAMKEEVQKLRKEKEQMQAQIKNIAAKAIQEFIDKAEIVEECDTFKTIKIHKNVVPNQQSDRKSPTQIPNAQPKGDQSNSKIILQQKEISKEPSTKSKQIEAQAEDQPSRRLKIEDLQKQILSIREKRKDAQILQLQKQLQKDQQDSVEAVVSKISTTLENNEKKLRKLREQRQKIFQKQQDVWSQLENI